MTQQNPKVTKRVLVVDDDRSVARTTTLVLQKNGFETDVALSGEEAIDASKLEHYDAVLIDLKLPDMEGTEVLSKADFGDAVKIMLTGYPSLVSGIQAMDRGVDAYLQKPVQPAELVGLIKAKLKSKRSSS